MHNRIVLGVVTVAALSGGCGPEASGPTISVTAAEFPAAYAQRFCARMSECCMASGGTTTGACEETERADAQADASEAQAAGATFDAPAASDCLGALDEASCSMDFVELRALLRRCDVWLGGVAPGDACTSGAACAEPGSNVVSGCSGGRCIAVEVLATGSACVPLSSTAICDPLIAECDSATSTCVPLPPVGQPCTSDCAPGARCGADNVCSALLSAGDACTLGGECLSDVCAGGRCASLLSGDTEYCTLP